jgi:hypothetical protein
MSVLSEVNISSDVVICVTRHACGTGGSFPGVKAPPGRDADRSPPSSAEVKE